MAGGHFSKAELHTDHQQNLFSADSGLKVTLWSGLRFCILSSLPADADASGPWTTPRGPWLELAPWLGVHQEEEQFPQKNREG